MSINITLVRAIISEVCNPGVLMMVNPLAGGGGASNPSNPTGASGGSDATTGRTSIGISDICNPQGPDTDTGEAKIRPIAERPKGNTYGPRGGVIPPYTTTAELKSDGLLFPDTRDKDSGPVNIYDPKNQDFNYVEGETSQPLANCTASAIEELHKKGAKLHDYFFSAKQKGFFCNVLRHEDREIYDKIFTNKRGRPATKTN